MGNLIWFCLKLDKYVLAEMTLCLAIRSLDMLPEAPWIIFMHQRKVIKRERSNGCLSLWHSIPFHVVKGCSEFMFFAWKLIVILVDMTLYQPYGLWYAVRISSNHLYTPKKGSETLNQQYMWVLMAQYPISHADLVPNMCSFDCNFREFFCYNWQGVNHYNHKGPIYTVRKAFQ